MRTIIAGSRTINKEDVLEAIAQCPFSSEIRVVLCGGAKGADTYGKEWAKAQSIPVELFLADWNKYRNAAGPIRNEQMGDNADALIAVWDGKSPGTKHMIKYAKEKNLKVFIYNPPKSA